MSNFTVLYSGTPHEAAVITFSAWLARGLNQSVECRFVADPRSVLAGEQWWDYQAVVGLEGFTVARPYMEESYHTERIAREAEARTAFEQFATAQGVRWGECLDLVRTPEHELSSLGFAHDLVFADFASNSEVLDLIVKQILIEGGGPISLIKAAPRAATLNAATVVLAWKPVATAKRALQAAIPILRAAGEVHVVSLADKGEAPPQPGAPEIAEFLREAHQVNVRSVVLPAHGGAPRQLAEYYENANADLLVMGGYSHSWLQELLFNGFTKYFVANHCANVLLAH
jgi:nucleotide-binding universal stress UspA family protein